MISSGSAPIAPAIAAGRLRFDRHAIREFVRPGVLLGVRLLPVRTKVLLPLNIILMDGHHVRETRRGNIRPAHDVGSLPSLRCCRWGDPADLPAVGPGETRLRRRFISAVSTTWQSGCATGGDDPRTDAGRREAGEKRVLRSVGLTAVAPVQVG